ncbi:sel1 repeat family protein [Variovorax beijingensis]|jgi:TPR repeat protein|uniref:Sel1 repeat family protein n=1 Tax=Variovorax beijingensis TaxID=2496117 RepID=A0A3P3F4U5_9BURK|nr:sel1 repeat family protein [Variovorax beijingensis]RRH92608.1 sel1 repeat family protein [Variovorax beijingensis]RSZ43042.1 sel1 repeat family protein [Variovorax beijingensis]
MASELNQIASGSLRWRIGLSAALCLAAALSVAEPLDAGVVLHAEQRFQLALEAQAARDYRSMLEQLRQAAAEDNAEAQEMLGMVLLAGPTLYGSAIKADRCEARQWMLRAASQGSDTARVQLAFLNRLRQSPAGRNACG